MQYLILLSSCYSGKIALFDNINYVKCANGIMEIIYSIVNV